MGRSVAQEVAEEVAEEVAREVARDEMLSGAYLRFDPVLACGGVVNTHVSCIYPRQYRI